MNRFFGRRSQPAQPEAKLAVPPLVDAQENAHNRNVDGQADGSHATNPVATSQAEIKQAEITAVDASPREINQNEVGPTASNKRIPSKTQNKTPNKTESKLNPQYTLTPEENTPDALKLTPASKKAAPTDIVITDPAPKEPATRSPVAQERVAQERVAQERVAQERVAQEPATNGNVTHSSAPKSANNAADTGGDHHAVASPITPNQTGTDQTGAMQPGATQNATLAVPARNLVTPKPAAKPNAKAGDALIRLNNVIKAYQTPVGEFVALRGINLSIGRGEFVAVVGKSGSGKSTLINMITGIDRPTSGEIFIDNTPIHNLAEGPMAEWRGRNVGIIFQFFQLLPMLSCIENVMLPMDFCNMFKPSERESRALHLLEQVDMVEHAYKLPSEVSGGQQQRVAIARAMANDPPLLVADEPTGNLDSRTAEAVFHLFERMVDAGKTILMVTHDDEMAHQVRRTITIADGQIVQQDYHTQQAQEIAAAAGELVAQ